MTPVMCHSQHTPCVHKGWRGRVASPFEPPPPRAYVRLAGDRAALPPRRSRRGRIPSFFGILMPVSAEQAWPDLLDQPVKGVLLLLPSPPRIAPSQLRLVE